MVPLDEVEDGDLGLAPGEELLDDVPSDEAAAADDEAAEGGKGVSDGGEAKESKEDELGLCAGRGGRHGV